MSISLPRSLAISQVPGNAGIRAGKGPRPAAAPPSAPPASTPAVQFSFSAKALDLMDRRSLSDLERQQYQGILERAADPAAIADPKAFLHSLTGLEMEVLRRAQSLADPIAIDGLSPEGAANLLVEPGAARDLDKDGLTTVGRGRSITFPPERAPASVKAAWAAATKGMDPLDIPMHLPFMIGLANIHQHPDGTVTSVEPEDPAWRNPFADPGYDYAGTVARVVAGIERQHALGQVDPAIFKRDVAFYTRLREAMAG